MRSKERLKERIDNLVEYGFSKWQAKRIAEEQSPPEGISLERWYKIQRGRDESRSWGLQPGRGR